MVSGDGVWDVLANDVLVSSGYADLRRVFGGHVISAFLPRALSASFPCAALGSGLPLLVSVCEDSSLATISLFSSPVSPSF